MKKIIVQYFCDLCFEPRYCAEDLNSVSVPVLYHKMDSSRKIVDSDFHVKTLELCDKCLDKVTLVETYVGKGCTAPTEGMFSWREDGKV